MEEESRFKNILDLAYRKGVSDAVIRSPNTLPVNDKFPEFCKSPGCSGYNQSMSCPPHAKNPDWFRSEIKNYKNVLIFKFDVPSAELLGNGRLDILGLIHETAGALEEFACSEGCTRAKGFAGGSCKEIFCREFLYCKVLHKKERCRNPHQARQSMSAVGINFLELTKSIGWKIDNIVNEQSKQTDQNNLQTVPMSIVAGLVLLN